MSVRLMGQVLDMPLAPNRKLVALVLANYADDDGNNVFPAVSTVARKASVGESTVRRIFSEWRSQGVLEVVRPARQHYPATYRLHIDKLQTSRIEIPEHPGFSLEVSQTSRSLTPDPSVNLPSSETTSPPQGAVRAERAPDLIFEAVVEACQLDQKALTKDQRGRVNAAVAQFKALNVLPEQILGAARRYRQLYPQLPTVTPQALTGNWGHIVPAITNSFTVCTSCGIGGGLHDSECEWLRLQMVQVPA